jgi:hypothetical protein
VGRVRELADSEAGTAILDGEGSSTDRRPRTSSSVRAAVRIADADSTAAAAGKMDVLLPRPASVGKELSAK